MAQTYYATIVPGLEQALLNELKQFKIKKPKVFKGGVEFQASNRGFYQVLQWSALANGLLLRLDSFRARDRVELYNKTQRIEWSRYFSGSLPVLVESNSHNSRMFGSGEIANTISSAIRSNLKEQSSKVQVRLTEDKEELAFRVQARFVDNQCTLSLDASGLKFYKRGWRNTVGKAPLRESTAQALLTLLGWKPGNTLVDPTCGSGTFIIEAARMASNLPPRLREEYALHHWSNFNQETWDDVAANDPRKAPETSEEGQLWGMDKHILSVMRAQQNSQSAEVADKVNFVVNDAARLTPPAGTNSGFLISNPPYGERLPQQVDEGMVTEDILMERFATEFSKDWTLGILLPRQKSPFHPKLDTRPIASFENGGLPVRFWKITHP